MSKLIVSLPWHLQNTGSPPILGSTGGSGGAALPNGWEYSYALANDANTLIGSGSAALNLLPQADKTHSRCARTSFVVASIDLPKVPKARLRSALDGLLEDRLLDDTHAMSFALSPDATAGKAASGVWIVACDKAWLTGAIAAFETAGCRVTQVVPEFWPMSEAMVYVTGSEDDAWLTRAATDGVLTLPLRDNDLSGRLAHYWRISPSMKLFWLNPPWLPWLNKL